jgi:hypothetical protein
MSIKWNLWWQLIQNLAGKVKFYIPRNYRNIYYNYISNIFFSFTITDMVILKVFEVIPKNTNCNCNKKLFISFKLLNAYDENSSIRKSIIINFVKYFCTIFKCVQQNFLMWQNSRLAHPILAPSLTGYFFSHSQCLVIWSQNTWGSSGSQVRSHGAPRKDPSSVKQSAHFIPAKVHALCLGFLTFNCTEVINLFTYSCYNTRNSATIWGYSHFRKTNEWMSY